LSTGQLHRDIAREMGIDALELNILAESDASIDDRVDAMSRRLAGATNDCVVDSRIAWHFIPSSLKVYLTVDSDVAAKRVLTDRGRFEEPKYIDLANAKEQLLERKSSEDKRYFEKYGIDRNDMSNYDVVVNTSLLPVEHVVECLLGIVACWTEGFKFNKEWLSPQLLLPTEHVRQLAREDAKVLRVRMQRDGFDPSFPVEVVSALGFNFIWDGHKRTSAALFSKLWSIPINTCATDDGLLPTGETGTAFACAAIHLSWYYDWEDVHGFRFMKYPTAPSRRRKTL
jgi:cytidylate kinase